MKYIAHRANIYGKNINTENSIEAINTCLNMDLDVEIDVWFVNNNFYLGHDIPLYQIDESFLMNKRLWCHAKNYQALMKMVLNKDIHCFWHDRDQYTLTSQKYIWAYPGSKIDSNTICVLPELCEYNNTELESCAGICSDNILGYKNAKNNL